MQATTLAPPTHASLLRLPCVPCNTAPVTIWSSHPGEPVWHAFLGPSLLPSPPVPALPLFPHPPGEQGSVCGRVHISATFWVPLHPPSPLSPPPTHLQANKAVFVAEYTSAWGTAAGRANGISFPQRLCADNNAHGFSTRLHDLDLGPTKFPWEDCLQHQPAGCAAAAWQLCVQPAVYAGFNQRGK
ncbi:unnamed protein product, partial [Closterium sp. NIES-53]